MSGVQSSTFVPDWLSVACNSGRECHTTSTTSERSEVHRIDQLPQDHFQPSHNIENSLGVLQLHQDIFRQREVHNIVQAVDQLQMQPPVIRATVDSTLYVLSFAFCFHFFVSLGGLALR